MMLLPEQPGGVVTQIGWPAVSDMEVNMAIVPMYQRQEKMYQHQIKEMK